MSHFIQYRLTTIAIGIFALNAIAQILPGQFGINPAAATEKIATSDALVEALNQKPAPQPGLGLDIGLEPIIPSDSLKQRIAIHQGATTDNSKQPVGLGVTTRVGTLGIGVDVTKSFSSQFDGRLGFNFGNLNTNRTDSGINYDSQLNLSSVQLLGDYYLFGNSGFRLTGGLVAQNNKVSVTSKPNANGTYTIDGTQYSASEVGTLTGDFKSANSIAPYLGIGIGKSANEGFGFNADLGVMFTGAPKVSLNASNPTFNNNPTARAQLDNQVRQTENNLKGFNVYPVLSVGVSYGF